MTVNVGTKWVDKRGDTHLVVLIPSNRKLALLNTNTFSLDIFNMFDTQLADILERDEYRQVKP